MTFRHGIGALVLAVILPFAGFADALDEARVQELVLETIRENPEIVMEAIAILEQRQAEAQATAQSEVLSDQRSLLESDPNAPVLGNPDGDVTVVEFFDYNCPYCKRAMNEVKGLIDADSGVRLVYREWPMLRFRRTRTLKTFVAVHASVHNHFNQERHLYSRVIFKLNRTAALAESRQLGAT